MGAQETSDRGRKLASKMRAVIGQQTFGDTPLRDVCVHKNVGSSFCTIVSFRYSMHNSVSTEPIRKQQNVLVTTISEGQRAKVIPRNYFSRAIREGKGNSRPTNRLARSFPRLTKETPPNPPTHTLIHTNPPKETLKHLGSPSYSEMGRCL